MKRILSLLLIINIPFFAFGQNTSLKPMDCTSDSLAYSVFLDELDSLGMDRVLFSANEGAIKKMKVFKLSQATLKEIQQSSYCSFLFYVAAFDHLLGNGLDLTFDYAKNRPSRMSIMTTGGNITASSLQQKNDDLREKHRIYKNFLFIKSQYEKYISQVYLSDKTNTQFKKLIDSLILYGTYKNPKTLGDILRSKYAHLTVEKLNQDIREQVRKGKY